MKAEQILQKSANKNMKRWELNTFKITHPTLYKTIIEAINEALIIDSVVVPKGTLCCPECGSKDIKTAIHTDYKECNKCYHYWAT
tara:strand:+ start:256 stop:510 length:255 start_codon:yes stop_codon:yes gene_type:complete